MFLIDFYLLTKKFPYFIIKKIFNKNFFYLNNNYKIFFFFFLNIKKILWVITPYIVFDKKIIFFLKVLKKNIKINIIISYTSDNIFIYSVCILFLKYFKNEINFYILKFIFNHKKIYIIDNKFILFGSMNFDIRSIYINLESIMIVSNKFFIKDFFFLLKKELIFNFLFFIKKKFLLKILFILSFLNYLLL
ncbi:putative endonuclease related to cardiolipin synthase [Candidatus Carsonella ruddii CS isolate Thao2000]|uniref:Putative endonuclease related to cardiolipin synthase n=1 Tax=Candidatus Carsonella ruddii CS isolate Thao2000 TaxID=1202537 RepID=J7GYS0_CARRU|nr:phospholipase D-like domain-containing protein [Candidatus Carsonella ruddii]AFP83748.1 putative endonuclease related to cardiolipin synthase [Candidatus Carsonella ruddii CS isolate Thao2000]